MLGEVKFSGHTKNLVTLMEKLKMARLLDTSLRGELDDKEIQKGIENLKA